LSSSVRLSAGVRQESVLSPTLFALYADDILLLAISVADPQERINLCLSELFICHLSVNTSKSTCMRLGQRHDIPNCVIVISGHRQSWSSELKFLGFVIVAGLSLKCKIQIDKQKLYASPNSILGRVHVKDFTHTTLAMIDVFCIPVLFYGTEALDMNAASIKAIDLVYNGVFVKLFNVTDINSIRFCQHATKFLPASYRLDVRTLNFFRALKSRKSSPLAAFLLSLCGDRGFDSLLAKYRLSNSTLLYKNLILSRI